MLKKLIKHDMRSISKSAVPMFIVSGIVSIVCCAMLYFTYGFSEDVNSVFGAVIVTSGFYLLGMAAIMVLGVVTAFISISRYYKSLFTDEGYLTMVLPVKTVTLFSAKLLSTFIWIAFAMLVTGACAIVALYLPTVLYNPDLIGEAVVDIKWMLGFGQPISGIARAALILELIGNVFSFISTVFIIITAVTLGSVILRKQRVIGCILFYFVINLLAEGVIGLAAVLSGAIYGENYAEAADLTVAVFSIILHILISCAMYFINLHILDKKFNIE